MRSVCGLDVHKDSVYLCILSEDGELIEKVFGVLTFQLRQMRGRSQLASANLRSLFVNDFIWSEEIFNIYQSTIGINNGAMIAKKDFVHVVSYV